MAQRTPSPSVLELHLLGPFRAAVDGRATDDGRWSRRKPALLVKLLALQPHRQLHREQAMELLWPEADPEAAANNLHKAVHMARRALEPGLRSAADSHFILSRGSQLILTAPGNLRVDVDAFELAAARALQSDRPEDCEAALAAYAGDLLPEDLYEEWAAARREQLRARRQELLMKLALLRESRGEYEQGIRRLGELLACDPTREEAHRRLMRLYALAGDRQRASRQFELCRDALRREFDVEPEPETTELHRQIAAGAVRPAGAVTRASLPGQGGVIESVAILPLSNESGDADMEYLSDGLTESIINALSGLPKLRVLARDTVFRYKGRGADGVTAGRELGVRAVLTGRVAQFRERLIVGVELVDAADGSQLWGERYDRTLADVISVQGEIAREICEKLRLKLSGEERARLSKRYTENAEAYRLYLKGRYFLNRLTGDDLRLAVDYFHQALAQDAGFAAACAGLADAYTIRSSYRSESLAERHAAAKSWAVKALELDDRLAEAHNSLAAVKLRHEWDWAGAEREFERAIELNPNYATARMWYASCLLITGRPDDAVREARRGLELDPVSLPVNLGVAMVLYHTRRYAEAVAHLQKAVELDPHYYPARVLLSLFYAELGEHEAALREGLQGIALNKRIPELLAMLAYVFALAGRREEARATLDELTALSERLGVSRSFDRAMVYIGLGDSDLAFEWLDRAYGERDVSLLFLHVARMFDSLRHDPRFADLMSRVGLAPSSG